ncbi:uncharacterized protein HD556DRAFT_1310050 [Suillus plorans]|uniref:Uncharacterized protein n=1 Tax=Suillus plorans TaxID=116603 RepID=A0A9P7DEQ0_9AGAM|nr:uncharacterized protein HD556DRAFT_1310050 [Suillus plorans]KAG1791167.1 hypothetical protein HD556DRAFT_1310050 [Suillus plorans]
MTGQHSFDTPDNSDVGQAEPHHSTSGSKPNNTPAVGPLNKDFIAWLGPFVPLHLWSPLRLTRKLKFKGIVGMHNYPKFQAYDVAAEFPDWHPSSDDPVAKKDKEYELCFNGNDDKITSMLADIYAGDLMRSKCVAGPATTPSGEPSNTTSTSETPSDSAATDVTSHYNVAPAFASEEDMYDCGWCDPVTAEIKENPHDCGWRDGPSETNIDQGWDHSTENPHDCRWEDAVVAKSMGILMNIYGPVRSLQKLRMRWMGKIPMTAAGMTSWIPTCGYRREPTTTMQPGVMDTTPTDAEAEAVDRFVSTIVVASAGDIWNYVPATTSTSNSSHYGAVENARDRVTELGDDVANIHGLLNIHRNIMDAVELMIARHEHCRPTE